MKRRCGAVQEVVDLSSDDESTNVRPAGKIMKRELTSAPSPEVIELRQKVAKLEKDFKGACRYARQCELSMEEAKKRVEFLENILDKKPVKIDDSDKKLAEELQKKLDETSMQLEDERKKTVQQEEQYVQKLEESSEELKEARKDAAVKVAQLQQFELQLKESKTRLEFLANIIDKKPANIDDSGKKLAEELQKKLDETSMRLEEERKKTVKLEEQHVQKLEECSEGLKEARKNAAVKVLQLQQFELQLKQSRIRVEYLESIIDKKPAEIDDSDKKLAEELQKKLEETSVQLEDERKKAVKQKEQHVQRILNHSLQMKAEATRANEIEKAFSKKLEESSEELKETKKDAAVKVLQLQENLTYLAQQLNAEKLRSSDIQRRFNQSVGEWRCSYEALMRANEDQYKDRRIEELTRLLAEYEANSLLQQETEPLAPPPPPPQPELVALQQLQLQSPPTSPEIPAVPTSINPALFLIPPPPVDNCWTNIFWLADPTALASIPYEKAVEQLQFLVTARDAGWKYRYEAVVRRESLYCCLCVINLTDIHILPHFFSSNHANQILRYSSAVFLAAFEYWQRKLQSIQQAPPPTADVVMHDVNDVVIID